MANLGEKDPVLWQISEKRTLFVGASPYRKYMGVPSPGYRYIRLNNRKQAFIHPSLLQPVKV